MSIYSIKGETLTGIANEIRNLTGETAAIATSDMEGRLAANTAELNEIADSQNVIIEQIRNTSNTDLEDAYITRTLMHISSPNAIIIDGSAFYSHPSLTTANFPNVTTIGNSAFTNCHALTTVNFPNVATIANNAFKYCTSLLSISFPNAATIGNNAFLHCSSLTVASFASPSIYTSAFNNCSSLTSLTFAGSSVATLGNTNIFANTPMSMSTYTGTFGSIYVPASLVTSYQTATNWVAYSSRITAI